MCFDLSQHVSTVPLCLSCGWTLSLAILSSMSAVAVCMGKKHSSLSPPLPYSPFTLSHIASSKGWEHRFLSSAKVVAMNAALLEQHAPCSDKACWQHVHLGPLGLSGPLHHCHVARVRQQHRHACPESSRVPELRANSMKVEARSNK